MRKDSKEKPQRRHPGLQPLSREHHHGLLLCWKIRTGLEKKVATERIKAYTDWFFVQHLVPHFEAEEQFVFPLLGDKEHPLVRQALQEHARLRHLFVDQGDQQKNLTLLEEELTAHIRYEERVLFPEIQKVATEIQLSELETLHAGLPFVEDWQDKFWEG